MNTNANAAGLFTQLLLLILGAVLVAKFAAYIVSELLKDSDRYTLVTMAECHACKKERVKAGLDPRQLFRLPVEVTQHRLFKQKSIPVQLCPDCDLGALDSALFLHKERLAEQENPTP